MRKIAHIVTAYQSVVTILDSKLRKLNDYTDIDLAVISSPPEIPCRGKPAVRYIPLKMARSIRPLSDFKSAAGLYRIFKREKFDIVHSHTAKAGFITSVAAWLARVPIVCHTYHGLPFFEGQNKRAYKLYRFLEKAACKFRDYVFSQNKRDMEECAKLIGNKDRALFEGNGVDIDYVKRSSDQQFKQASKEFESNGLKLLLISRLEPVKRINDFFKVASLLKKQGVRISCVVAGTGFLEQQLRNKLREMELEDCVNMVGFSDCPHGLIAASDIVVLCSEKEGIPRTVMEAMALEKPVVGTDVLGTQEVIEDGKTGFLVPLGNIEKIAEKIKLLANDKQLCKSMGKDGLQRIEENFNDIQIAECLHNFYLCNAIAGEDDSDENSNFN